VNILRVALDVPLPKLFDYRAADATRSDIGRRVLVPFGSKRAVGVIVEIAANSEIAESRLRPIEKILRDVPPLSREWLALAEFCSGYYHRPLGEVLMAALPPRLRTAKAVPQEAENYSITAAGEEALAATPKGRKRVRAILSRLSRGPASATELAAPVRGGRGLLRECLESGWIRAIEPTPQGSGFVSAHELTQEQRNALAFLRSGLAKFRVSLLFGVTGSGKTEVYLQLIAEVLARHRQVLVLVPEIALTPALETAFRARFPGARLVVQTSAMAEGERTRGWLRAQRGQAEIVLGTRLAVYTPMQNLGLVVVDEEQDSSFKQGEGFRYSARDLAVVRARQRAVPVVLGSATPAVETYHNAISGRYALLELTRRIGAPPPRIACIDTRGEKLSDGLSERLLTALRQCTARGEQALVFINRRGYAPVLMCRSCGWISGCRRCSARLVLHLPQRRLCCHHCGHVSPPPVACPSCGNPDLAPIGQGTQRVEEALARLIPQARVLRIDRDTTRRRRAWHTMRQRIQERDVDILVGTQILAKGHDFPYLNLVGVLNADSQLYGTDFRAAERLFALLTQVAGRAGRGAVQGEVLIQTEFPHHPLYAALRDQDYRAFADAVLAERRQTGFPPFVHQALLRAEAPRLATALQFLTEAARCGKALDRHLTAYDPVPAALARRAGRERAQLLVQAASRRRLHEFLDAWRNALASSVSTRARWSIDVDPLEF